ncbi:MAG: hypothetical protein MJY67_07595 [Bacteroidales bacterium]|nr:hypothetical protein [Bacteroidales bacterium]
MVQKLTVDKQIRTINKVLGVNLNAEFKTLGLSEGDVVRIVMNDPRNIDTPGSSDRAANSLIVTEWIEHTEEVSARMRELIKGNRADGLGIPDQVLSLKQWIDDEVLELTLSAKRELTGIGYWAVRDHIDRMRDIDSYAIASALLSASIEAADGPTGTEESEA